MCGCDEGLQNDAVVPISLSYRFWHVISWIRSYRVMFFGFRPLSGASPGPLFEVLLALPYRFRHVFL